MEGAEAIALSRQDNCFLQLITWLESVTYLEKVFVLDIDFSTYGVTLYGPDRDVEGFRRDMAKGVEYIQNNETEGY